MIRCVDEYAPVSLTSPAHNEGTEETVIRAEDPLTVPTWDQLVAATRDYSFFHGSAWARVLQETYGFKSHYLVARDDSSINGLLPIMEVDSWLTGRRGVSLPFTDDCATIAPDPETFEHLHRQALQLGKSRRWKYFESRSPGSANIATEIAARPSVSFYGHRLDLTIGEEALRARLESSVRRAIRKGEAAGVKVEISSTLEAMRTYYNLHCKTRKKHGVPPQPFTFFASIYRQILAQNLGFVATARIHDTPIAAAVYFHLGTRAIYKFGASDDAYLELRGNNQVMWHAIQWYARAGFESLDFGRTSLSNDGLRRFKLGWGGTEKQINYFKYDFREEQYVPDRDDAVGWKNRIIGRLPIGIGKLIGSFFYRHAA